jgi:hypothetical protein
MNIANRWPKKKSISPFVWVSRDKYARTFYAREHFCWKGAGIQTAFILRQVWIFWCLKGAFGRPDEYPVLKWAEQV